MAGTNHVYAGVAATDEHPAERKIEHQAGDLDDRQGRERHRQRKDRGHLPQTLELI